MLNTDFNQRLVIRAAEMEWLDSPEPGVQRRMLERAGGEMAMRATSVVRYAPGAAFSPHRHDLGEEILVLEGVFSDEHGDYPVGSYVRNPPGSRHRPFSSSGCVIFVKLGQFDPADNSRVRVDTGKAAWLPTAIEGQCVMPLFKAKDEYVSLLKLAPGTALPLTRHAKGHELLVLAGSFSDDQGQYPPMSWLRLPAGSSHRPRSASGCVLWSKSGHLDDTGGRFQNGR